MKIIKVFFTFLLALAFFSCSKDNDPSPPSGENKLFRVEVTQSDNFAKYDVILVMISQKGTMAAAPMINSIYENTGKRAQSLTVDGDDTKYKMLKFKTEEPALLVTFGGSMSAKNINEAKEPLKLNIKVYRGDKVIFTQDYTCEPDDFSSDIGVGSYGLE